MWLLDPKIYVNAMTGFCAVMDIPNHVDWSWWLFFERFGDEEKHFLTVDIFGLISCQRKKLRDSLLPREI